ncbi:MAG: hypothetical protein ACOZAN_02195 [Patescibacteria group bacterium]
MTLIAGCRTWNGVCLATDTRVTYKPPNGKPFYKDDCQKCETITGGPAIAVAGDCRTATLFKQSLTKKYIQTYQGFVKRIQNGEKLNEDPITVLKDLIKESLIEVSNLDEIMKRDSGETAICGLIGVIDLIPLKLNSQECSNIINSLKYTPEANQVFFKNSIDIFRCAGGEIDSIEIDGFKQNALISFENIVGVKLEINEVQFGQIAAFGSGVSDDHAEEQYKTLAYLLLQTHEDDLQTAAFHLTRTHGWSEQVIPEDERYGFKTFGGANLAMMLMPDPKDPNNHVELAVLKGKFHRQSDKKVISDVYENGEGKLCVKGEDGIEYLLKPFSQYDIQGMDSLELAINQKP